MNQAIGKHDLDGLGEIQSKEALKKISHPIRRHDFHPEEIAMLLPALVAKI